MYPLKVPASNMMKRFIIPHKKGTKIRKSDFFYELHNWSREITLLKWLRQPPPPPRAMKQSCVKGTPVLNTGQVTHPIRIDAINLAKLLKHPLWSPHEWRGAFKLFDLCNGRLCGFLVCHCQEKDHSDKWVCRLVSSPSQWYFHLTPTCICQWQREQGGKIYLYIYRET